MSAIADHWEKIIKRRLVENVLSKDLGEDLTRDIAHTDLHTLNSLLDYVRLEAWQDGHDTALIHGQIDNPHCKEWPRRRHTPR